ncbi:MAG: biosynthetic-type acetolactate synthase large subunit [Elusimicrobiota bacterium]|nr:biosynthetic-type acetolactate synthase large subunit [Elusimicrobiota bacterium]
MEITGAQILIESLLKEKVEVVFGIPGGPALFLFDEIYKSGLNFVLARHEQGAVHMADGYARATGNVGVGIFTSGPGATNTVTGIATAYMDSVPLVLITGQVMSTLIGQDGFQEVDITGITRPITKHNYLIKDVSELAKTVKEAFYIASSGKPGPVLIDLPGDVQRAKYQFDYPKEVDIRSYKPTIEGHIGQIKKAAKIINNSKNPVLYIGAGVVVSKAQQEVLDISLKGQIPTTNTLLAIGAYPYESELSLNMLGMHGTFWANKAVQAADVIVAVGARFDDRCTGKVMEFAKNADIIHIDIDPSSISKILKTDIPVVGDAKVILTQMEPYIEKKDRHEWIAQIKDWKSQNPLRYNTDDNKLHPQYVIEKLSELTKGEAIVTTEVGQHQMWAAQYYKANGARKFLSSGGLGTMGFGFPAAIGAKIGNPDKEVVVIAGDGSFQMNMQEMAVCIVNDVSVKVIVINNQFLGMVRQWQEMFYNRHYSSSCLAKRKSCPPKCNTPQYGKCPVYVPDFVLWAKSYGADGLRVSSKKDVVPSLEKMLASKNSFVLDVKVEQEENVFPMVPVGNSLDDMLIFHG